VDYKQLRNKINLIAEITDYDHREHMQPDIAARFPHMMADEQLIYSRFKYAVAHVLKPKLIFDIGTGWGVSALAFKAGYQESAILSIDNGESGIDPQHAVTCAKGEALRTADLYTGCEVHYRSHDINVGICDSSSLTSFTWNPAYEGDSQTFDLIYVDGGHGLEHKASDIVKAIEARPEWILVDDMQNVMVAAGTFAGLYMSSFVDVEMMYFNGHESLTGNLLIHAKRMEPTYRRLEVKRLE
jgi:hypothetical protein